MEYNKRQNIYKIIMLIVLVAVITFISTSIFMYNNLGGKVKYVPVSYKDNGLSSSLASIRKIIDQKFLGEIDENKILTETIKGYVNGLDDPYTEYMTKEEMRRI